MLFIGSNPLSGIGQVVRKYSSLFPESKIVEYGSDIEKGSDVFVFALPIPDVIQYLIHVKERARKVVCMTVCETETVHELYGHLVKLFPTVYVPSEFCQQVFSRQFPDTKFDVIRHHVPLFKVVRNKDTSTYIFYHIGNVEDPRKQTKKIIEAFMRLNRPDTLLVLKATCKQPVKWKLPRVHIINGRPAFSANLLAQAVRRHPDYDYRVLEKTSKICRIRFLSRGELLGEELFTIEMAERAGLLKNPTWRSYPEAMLFSRALTAGMRTHCPDALGGSPAYTPEELGASDVVPVTVTEPAPPAPALVPDAELLAKAYAACGDAGLSDDGLIALVDELSKGAAQTLDQLPLLTLQRLAKVGVSAETVVRCNGDEGATTEDPDDLPAAWAT